MSGQKRWLIVLLVLCAAFAPLSLAFAQTAEPTAEIEDVRTIVLSAFNRLATESYYFTFKSVDLNRMIYDEIDGIPYDQTQANLYLENGYVVPGGDNITRIQIAYGDSDLESLSRSTRLVAHRIVSKGEVFLKIEPGDYAPREVSPGWHRFPDMLDAIDPYVQIVKVNLLAHMPLPPDVKLVDAVIREIVEGEPEVVEGVRMRVFDLEIDPFKNSFIMYPDRSLDNIAGLIQNPRLFAASRQSLTYRMWVSEADGRLYRLTIRAYSFLPYHTFKLSESSSYDLENWAVVDYVMSHYGEPVEIEAPVTVRTR